MKPDEILLQEIVDILMKSGKGWDEERYQEEPEE